MFNDTVNIFQTRLKREGYSNVFKKDILEVIMAAESTDYTAVFKTRLYTKQGAAYCRLIEYINELKPKLFNI
ncbi:hypothetical protein AGMMS49975_24650 [Clostridia bacterium]|nr:hypothetical protein AGMMS49975_24650 [Clostridia bacterium]